LNREIRIWLRVLDVTISIKQHVDSQWKKTAGLASMTQPDTSPPHRETSASALTGVADGSLQIA